MVLVALLSARIDGRTGDRPAATVDFGSQSLIEYQARLAIEAGAERVLVQIDSPTPELARTVDRLLAEHPGAIALVQDMPGLARHIAPDDRVLLLAEALVLPPEALASLVGGDGEAMLTLPSVPATALFERIDGQAMWAGAALLSGGRLLATLDMLGDWDLVLTLLRRAVQAGLPRIELSPDLVMDARLTLVTDQSRADIALGALSDEEQAKADARSGGLASLLAPLSRRMVRELVRRQVDPERLTTIALLIACAGLALALAGWMLPGLVVLLIALGLADLAQRCALVTLRDGLAPLRQRGIEGLAAAVSFLLGWRISAGMPLALAGTWLPLILAGLLMLADRTADHDEHWPAWLRPTLPVVLLLLAVGVALGIAPAAFILLGLLAIGLVALRLFRPGGIRV
jgi:hypothetical protein